MVSLKVSGTKFQGLHALIFDKDGTLENSRYYLEKLTHARLALLECLCSGIATPLAKAYGFDQKTQRLDSAGLMAVGSRHDNVTAAAAYIAERGYSWYPAWHLALDCFNQADRQVIPDAETCPLFPGVKAQFQWWQQQGLKIAIVSAARQWSVERFIADHALGQWIDVAMGSDQGVSKPDPALYRIVCDKLQIPPSATLMVGDAQGDITMAKQAEARGAIAIHWPGYPTLNLVDADATINNLKMLVVEA